MLKPLVKTTFAGALYHSGVLGMIKRPPLTVLGYHRVLEGPLEKITTCPPGMVATPEMFERQIAHAARRYRMVSLEEISEACEAGRPLPPRACHVTFDDGWRDNHAIAYPILRRLGVPATVFVTTDYIGTQEAFWFTPLMHSLLAENGRRPRRGDGREIGWPEDLAGELDRLASLPRPLHPAQLDPLVEMMKRHPEADIEEMVASLTARLDGGPAASSEEPHFLRWDEIREMDRDGISFGSHTCTHKILTQIDDEQARQELERSRKTLEAELGHPVRSFAFPNGDYSPEHMTMAWDAGYRLFFVSTRVHPGGPAGRVFPRPCVWDHVGRGPAGRFSPSLLEFHLAGVVERLRGGGRRA